MQRNFIDDKIYLPLTVPREEDNERLPPHRSIIGGIGVIKVYTTTGIHSALLNEVLFGALLKAV